MSTNHIVAELDAEIARLRSALAVLTGATVRRATRGRAARKAVRTGVRRKRTVSAATRALIAEKMRQAWARGRKKHK
jgi:hypothetical protein